MTTVGSYGSYALELQAALEALQNQYNYASLAQAQEQFLKQLAWAKTQAAAETGLTQQQLLGYIQTEPFLTSDDANVLTYGDETWAKTLEREIAEWSAGLDYANILAGLSGPSDWIKYINVARGLGSTYDYPAYMQAVASQAGLPSFQSYVGDSPSYEDLWDTALSGATTDATANATGSQSADQATADGASTTVDAEAEAVSNWVPPSPNQVSMKTLNSLLPSELEMLQGSVEAAGYDWDDYLEQAQAAAPAAFSMVNTRWAQ